MSDFDEMIREDARIFLEELGGERCTYYRVGAAPRSILAIIRREEPKQLNPKFQGSAYRTFIEVENNSVRGISQTEFDHGSDTITIPLAGVQGKLTPRSFSSFRSKVDAGMWTLEVL